jgi:hypothetical protein
MILKELIHDMFMRGLGQLLVLHLTNERVFLGHVSYEKGKLMIRDRGLLDDGVKPAQLAPCWDYGLLGCLYNTNKFEWNSLTFCGLEQTDMPVDLSDTRQGALHAAQNQYGENLINFIGSVYRGYQLMLDNHHLPVVTLKPINTRTGEVGLAVCDLRAAPIDLAIIRKVNDIVRESIEKQLLLEVEDVQVNSEKFDEMFGNFLSNN